MLSLDGFLTYFAFLAAALAIMDPVQRKSLLLFIPRRRASIMITIVLILLAFSGFAEEFNPNLGMAAHFSSFLVFSLLLLETHHCCWNCWKNAKITKQNANDLESFFLIALRENKFDEVERVLRKNSLKALANMPDGAATVLFQSTTVRRMMESNSFVYLDLLSDLDFYQNCLNARAAMKVVIRNLVYIDASPLRSFVINYRGDDDSYPCQPEAENLLKKTFLNPKWYRTTESDCLLIAVALDEIRSSKLELTTISRMNCIAVTIMHLCAGTALFILRWLYMP